MCVWYWDDLTPVPMSEALSHGADAAVVAAATAALALVRDGACLGLGSGRAASEFIGLLGARVRAGMQVTGVPTSRAAADRAMTAGITLVTLGPGVQLDLTVDGADEVAPNLDLIKGWGGALVQERIVAASSQRQVILVGPEKQVAHLGARGRIPVEVIPMARWPVQRAIERLGLGAVLRVSEQASPVRSDNGNLTLDCAPRAPLADGASARALERALLDIPGVVDTGLFLGTADAVLVGHADGRVDTLLRGR